MVRQHFEALQDLLVDELDRRVGHLVDQLLDHVVAVVAHDQLADVASQLCQQDVQQLGPACDFLDDFLDDARGAGVHAQRQDSAFGVLHDELQLRGLLRGDFHELYHEQRVGRVHGGRAEAVDDAREDAFEVGRVFFELEQRELAVAFGALVLAEVGHVVFDVVGLLLGLGAVVFAEHVGLVVEVGVRAPAELAGLRHHRDRVHADAVRRAREKARRVHVQVVAARSRVLCGLRSRRGLRQARLLGLGLGFLVALFLDLLRELATRAADLLQVAGLSPADRFYLHGLLGDFPDDLVVYVVGYVEVVREAVQVVVLEEERA